MNIMGDFNSDIEEIVLRDQNGNETNHCTREMSNGEINEFSCNDEKQNTSTWRTTPLHKAVGEGNLTKAAKLLACMDPNVKNESGATPLHKAASKGNVRMVSLLLNNGADPNVRDAKMFTPLHYAILEKSKLSVKILLKHGARINSRPGKTSPLHIAATDDRLDILQILLKKGAKINTRDENGQTALHWASFRGANKAFIALSRRGADLHAKDLEGHNVLHAAILGGASNMASLLYKQYPKLNEPNRWKQLPLHLSIIYGRNDVSLLILKDQSVAKDIKIADYKKNYPIHYAAEYNRIEVLEILIQQGAFREVRNEDFDTPLHLAAQKNNAQVIRILRRYAVGLHPINNLGQQPIHCAILNGAIDAVQCLLKLGANPNCKSTYNGNTALHFGMLMEEETIIVELVKCGAKLTTTNDMGQDSMEILRRKLSVYDAVLLPAYKAECRQQGIVFKEKDFMEDIF